MPDIELAKVTISRTINPDGVDSVTVHTMDGSGEPLTVLESLGLIEYARITFTAETLDQIN